MRFRIKIVRCCQNVCQNAHGRKRSVARCTGNLDAARRSIGLSRAVSVFLTGSLPLSRRTSAISSSVISTICGRKLAETGDVDGFRAKVFRLPKLRSGFARMGSFRACKMSAWSSCSHLLPRRVGRAQYPSHP